MCKDLISISTIMLLLASNNAFAHYSREYKVRKNPTEREYIRDQGDDRYRYKEPTARTQVNEQTDLFDKSITNWDQFQEGMDPGQFAPTSGSEIALDFVEEGGMARANAEKDSLSSIRASDLDSRGRAKFDEFRREFPEDSDLYVDYTRPLNKRLLEDAASLADGQDELLGDLIGKLKELGVDCKTVKGPKVVEPEFYMQIKTKEHKDSVYNQTICEELRGHYNCTDNMSLHCLEKGWSHPWESEEREIKFNHSDVTGRGWSYSVHWKRKRHGIHFGVKHRRGGKPTRSPIEPEVRAEIAKRLGVEIEHIHPNIRINARGNGEPYHEIWPQFFAWDTYSVFYRYRDGHETCEKWSEERWDESCGLR